MCQVRTLLSLLLSSCLGLVACADDSSDGTLDALDVTTPLDLATSDGAEVASEVVSDVASEVASETVAEVVEDAARETGAEVEDVAAETTEEIVEVTDATEEVEDVAVTDALEVVEDVAVETLEEVAEDVGVDVPEVIVPEELPPADAGQLSASPYLMWVTQSEVSVRWETKTAVVGRVDFGPTDMLGATVVEPEARTTHELRLTGLPPNNLNAYRIVYGGGALPIRHFWTAPPDDYEEPIDFVVWGDNQNGPGTFDDLMPVMADAEPRFAFSVGDCVQNGTRGEYRSQLFGPMSGFADEVPYLVAAGNHERYSDPNALLFAEYFSQPADEHCFGWRYGGFFLLVIDTDLTLADQRSCIDTALASDAAKTARIQAAAFHKPPRVEWWFGGQLAFTDEMEAPWVREELEPILEEHGVDVVFNGHNHLYAHTPETDGGIVWVTTGGAGGMLDTEGAFDIWRVGNWPEIETTIHEFHILRARLEADELFIEAVDIDGEVMHSFYVYGD